MAATFPGRTDSRRRWALLCPFLLLTPCLVGCGRPEVESRRLTIISPHRDEIRIETAQAFEDWFGERSRHGKQAALTAVGACLDSDAPEKRTGAATALDALLADWNPDDASDVRQARGVWRAAPTRESTDALRQALNRWEPPPVKVVWQDVGGGTSQIVKYVQSGLAARPAGIGIDLLFGGGTDIYLQLSKVGVLERVDVPAPVLSRIPAELNGFPLYDPQRRWFGPMLSSFGILANRAVLERIGEPVPESWVDLGRPGLRGWVATGDPRMTGSVHTVLEIILQGQGWDAGMRLLMRMGANTHTFIRDSGTLTRQVSLGEVAAAGNIDVQALGAVARNPEMIQFQLPPGETIVNPDAVATLKGAPQPGLARAFIEFTLSDAGQRLFCLRPGQPGGPRRYPLGRLSVLPSLYADFPPEARSTGTANPFALKNTVRYDSNRGGRRWNALNDLFGAWVVDAHPDLRDAWRAVLASPAPAEERQRLELELFTPPCTEKELDDYATNLADGNPRVRTETITRWGEAARERYRRIRREAGR